MYGTFQVLSYVEFIDNNNIPRSKKVTLLSQPCLEYTANKLAATWKKNNKDCKAVCLFIPDTIIL